MLEILVAASILVDAATGCVDARETEMRLAAAIALAASAREPDLRVLVVSSGSTVSLGVRDRESMPLLDREWSITPRDCESVPDLLATVLTRFLDGFPRDRWSRPRPPASGTEFRPPRVVFRVSSSATFVPSQAEPLLLVGGEAEVAMSAEIHRGLAAGVVGRGGTAGTAVLAEAGWRRVSERFAAGIALRAGLHFHDGATLVWGEGGAWAAGRVGPLWLGPHIWAAPARGSDIASGRVGIAAVVPF